MRRSAITVFMILSIAALVTVNISCGLVASQAAFPQDDSGVNSFNAARIRDACSMPDGTPVLLFRQTWASEDRTPPWQHQNISKEFIRLFRHPTNPNAKMGVAWLGADRKNGLGIYESQPDGMVFRSHISERMRQPSFFQSEAGDIFIGSRTGVIYWVKPDGTHLRYQIPLPKGEEPDLRKLFRRIEFTSFPDSNLVCAYSIADPRYHSRALYGIAVADPESGWRTVELGDRATGPAAMVSESNLKMLQYDRWLDINLEDGTVTESAFQVPREKDEKVKPIALARLADGTLMSIWRRFYGSFRQDDLPAFSDGRYQRICQWVSSTGDGNQQGLSGWKYVYSKDAMISKLTANVPTDDGGWWLTKAEGGLVYRSPDGQFREFNYRSGVPSYPISRIKLDSNDSFQHLWLLGNSVLRIDTQKLLATTPVNNPQWRELTALRNPGIRTYAPFRPVGPIITSGYSIILPNDWDRQFPFPSAEVLSDRKQVLAFQDRFDRPWLVDTSKNGRHVFGYVDGKWEKHVVSLKNEDRWVESVAQWFSGQGLVKEIDYLGEVAVFGPGNRIATLIGRKVSVFDGASWTHFKDRSLGTNYRYGARSLQFTEDSLVAWFGTTLAFELPFHRWSGNSGVDDGTWTRHSTFIKLKEDYRERRGQVSKWLSNSPLKGASPSWICRDHQLRLAQFAAEKMAVFESGQWSVVPAKRYPLSVRRSIYGIARQPDGSWIFCLGAGQGPRSIVVYQPDDINLRPEARELGSLDSPESELTPKWVSDVGPGRLQLRFRVDKGKWSSWIDADQPIQPGPVVPKGQHQLSVQLHSSNRVLPLDPLVYTFDVKYDLSERITGLFEGLSAMDFQTRQESAQQFIDMGPTIQETLRDRLQSETDPEVRAAIISVLDQLGNE